MGFNIEKSENPCRIIGGFSYVTAYSHNAALSLGGITTLIFTIFTIFAISAPNLQKYLVKLFINF